jgi:hypothetical protein
MSQRLDSQILYFFHLKCSNNLRTAARRRRRNHPARCHFSQTGRHQRATPEFRDDPSAATKRQWSAQDICATSLNSLKCRYFGIRHSSAPDAPIIAQSHDLSGGADPNLSILKNVIQSGDVGAVARNFHQGEAAEARAFVCSRLTDIALTALGAHLAELVLSFDFVNLPRLSAASLKALM